MRTTKTIATISFNTREYLELKLRELTNAKRLSFWAFVCHKPEDDEGGKKEHFHVFVEPSKMIQTDDLKEALKEFDPEKPDKPKGCISFRFSKFDDWYMYVLHDVRYLAQKGQLRKFHYVHDDIVTSDPDELLFRSRSIDLISLSPYADMIDAQSHGISWAEYFRRGTVPLQQLAQWEKAWNLLITNNVTFRNGRPGHPNDIDPDTGEMIGDPDPVPGASNSSSDDVSTLEWYDVHPDDDLRSLDPETGLPFDFKEV